MFKRVIRVEFFFCMCVLWCFQTVAEGINFRTAERSPSFAPQIIPNGQNRSHSFKIKNILTDKYH